MLEQDVICELGGLTHEGECVNSYECECGWGSLVARAPPRAHVNSSVQFVVSSELDISRLHLPDTMVR